MDGWIGVSVGMKTYICILCVLLSLEKSLDFILVWSILELTKRPKRPTRGVGQWDTVPPLL